MDIDREKIRKVEVTETKSQSSSRLAAINIKITPLYGCLEDTGKGAGPVCSLLEVGDVTILLDCGWDMNFNESLLNPLASVVSKIDLVLISHADLEHMGGLPYAVGRLGMTAPIFTTLPTFKMGQMVLYDSHQVRTVESGGSFNVFSLDDVDNAFECVKCLKYSQLLKFSEQGRGAGVTITPYAAGHIIGSSIWRISWQTEDNDIVYAVRFNHRREEHLNGGAIETFIRPSIMITDAHNSLNIQSVPPRKRAAEFIDIILGTLQKGGNVLIPCDAAGRVLEHLLVLDNYWSKHKLSSYPIVLLHSMAFNTGEFAKSQLEWMSDAISKQFDLQRSNPFDMKHITMAHTLEEVQSLGSCPKVVLATHLSLDYGFAKGLLLAWASDPANLILLTQKGHGNTLAAELLSNANSQAQRQDDKIIHVQKVLLEVPERIPLVGEELALYLEEEARKRRQAAEEEEHKRQAEEMELGQVLEDSDEEAIDPVTSLPVKRKRAPNASLFSKFSKPQHLMFGYHDIVVKVDDYGVKEAEPIGWLAISMQERNDKSDLIREEDERRKLEQKAEEALLSSHTNSSGNLNSSRTSSSNLPIHSSLHSDSAYYQDSGMFPSKIVSREKELQIRARISFLDMEGVSDGRSVRNLLTTVGPRQLVLIGGSAAAVASLSDDAKKRQMCSSVFTPKSGEIVQVHFGTDVQDVILHDSLTSHLRWQIIRGYELAQVDCTTQEGQSGPQDGKKAAIPTLVPHENRSVGETGCPAIYVSFGEVQLTQLSSALKKAGMTTSFAAAKLTVNGCIEITKDKDGQIKIDGPLTDDYFAYVACRH